ncbi:AAA family ATPase [Elizabethkingia anophelis]|uniref:ATP-dependent nuclease n=1 Tax=Flavobacterium lindanitolerans TaxID=428988 RepID=UPI0021A51B2F|nr:AAA family ATPase [Elizabethkingia anophelis]MCT3810906.1 AAA family ATPase [Elizabethkingia anophelis]MCT3818000.1 AAA family ATPase [Elizabethkingia anophelis]MCT3940234.1 AAA family ATPase [Elizabethkingia anophelis]MCT4192500.1 AAA family ATPase [Elizabethkingia anophelis]
MILAKVKLIGFRNFKNATIRFNEKSLIIGSNDVGKTNLIWAIRLLLDRSLTDFDIEPQDSDFYAFEETNNFKITLYFADVIEDCVVSKLKGKISDKDELILRYEGYRDPKTKAKSYKLFAGSAIGKLEEIDDRYYRKVLNLKYIGSRRDLTRYISKEKNYLFQAAKENRTAEESEFDDKLYAEVQGNLKSIDESIPKLHFVKNATTTINDELAKLSSHHSQQQIVFDSATSNLDSFINSVSISAKSEEQSVLIGGDGRLNQIYLALWTSRNQLREENLNEVTIFCIEEPEAHLHPHQQRKLAEYLNSELYGQVLITTHSPQIASEFSPNSIIRIYNKDYESKAASDGCSEIIDEAFQDFGYRMSIIPAEAFFANAVFLVEGPSEEIFYKTLAKQLGIDLDRLNISILMVDGISFKIYVRILQALNIDWVLRTDNDIFKVPKKDEYRFAGIHRCISIYKDIFKKNDETETIIKEHYVNTIWDSEPTPKQKNIDSALIFIEDLEDYNMFLSKKDLENDLVNSPILKDLQTFFDEDDKEIIVSSMQKNKATFMYKFLRENKDCLKKLKNDDIAIPLISCVNLIS